MRIKIRQNSTILLLLLLALGQTSLARADHLATSPRASQKVFSVSEQAYVEAVKVPPPTSKLDYARYVAEILDAIESSHHNPVEVRFGNRTFRVEKPFIGQGANGR